jgi:helicase
VRADDVRALLLELDLDPVVREAYLAFFDEALSDLRPEDLVSTEPVYDADPERLALALERLSVSAQGDASLRRRLFDEAFVCRRAVTPESLERRAAILHYFFLATDALVAERHAELVMLLREIDVENDLALPEGLAWPDELLLRVARAFVFLCRKGSGWDDVRRAASEIEQLRGLQEQRERPLTQGDEVSPTLLASLIARYNVAKLIDVVTTYTISGQPTDALIVARRHKANVDSMLEVDPDPELEHVADLLFAGIEVLVAASIWSYARRGLGARVDEFIERLVGREEPLLELWPSQRVALSSSLLDPAKRAIVVEMPTSAGKTLLAEFAIVQALALYPDRRVVYVVPTRALVNQATRRLRHDLGPLDVHVEAAVPVFELDPTEDAFLRRPFNVLVVTPEKLDLLVRSDHPAVSELSLVVADEAHNIGADERGARLELLLAMVRRERAGARFLLLTPFVPNGAELAAWLGGEGAAATIEIDWRPSERMTAAARWKKIRGGPYELKLLTLPSAGLVDGPGEVEFNLGAVETDRNPSISAISASSAATLARRGGVLVLARGRGTAETRAEEIADLLPEQQLSELGTAVLHFAESELGVEHPLPRYLQHGVAFHHAGISHDLRYLIELMIDRGDVRVVCGTTTLAQGVNFPIASVIVETLKRPVGDAQGWSEFTFSEFWNIAGRAGRALRDRVGLVVFPARNDADVEQARVFLAREATEIASALIEALVRASDAADRFDLSFIRRHRTFSVFLQYLMHALRVAGFETAQAELQDLLRSSLVYHQIEQEDRRLADRLVTVATSYLESIRGRERGYLALADGTGFSLASVDYLYARYRDEHPEFSQPAFWQPEALFGGDPNPLAGLVELIAQVPEISLGRSDVGPFNPHVVAGVVADWVQGRTASEIADRWFADLDVSEDKRRRLASHYLHSSLIGQVPWGFGAVQRLAIGDPEALAEVAHVPSLVFYGVQTKEAATLRMAGVPRVAAEGLAQSWRQQEQAADSFEDVRRWLRELDEPEWARSLPEDSPLAGTECRDVWQVLAGES